MDKKSWKKIHTKKDHHGRKVAVFDREKSHWKTSDVFAEQCRKRSRKHRGPGNTVGKGELVCFEHFLPIRQCFQSVTTAVCRTPMTSKNVF